MTKKDYLKYFSIIFFLLLFIIILIIFFPHQPLKQNSSAPTFQPPLSTLTIEKTTGTYSYKSTTEKYQTYFKDSPLKEAGISFHTGKSEISFYTPQKQIFGDLNPTTSQIENNILTYKNIYTDTDLRYSVFPSRLLEEFVVNSQVTALKFTQISQIVNTKNIDKYQINSDGSIAFFYQSKLILTLPKPVMYELTNQKNNNYGIKYQITEAGPNTYQISKIITPEGLAWLNHLNRSYPIAIDLVIDNSDTSINWISSDPTNTVVSQETTIKQEGTGSVKIQTSNATSTTVDLMEYSSDTNAQTAYVTNSIIAIGGTETTSGVYRLHTFTTDGTLSVTVGGNMEVLVVGGGGAGGKRGNTSNNGGGGGGGGIAYNSSLAVAAGNVSAIVGPTQTTVNTVGNNSSFSTLTGYGGGAGGNGVDGPGGDGGCGGGAAGTGGATNGGGTGSQGYDGGNSGSRNGAGGGGMGAAGNPASTSGGSGGAGIAYSITGSSVYYAGGGAGGSNAGISSGGIGGGGDSGTSGVLPGAGTDGLGGGGGGGANGADFGYGGSGVVIVSHPDTTLQSYTESTIKTQGTYSLKTVAKATNSLNKTLTHTIVSPLDLSGVNSVTFDIRSTRTGSNIKVGLHDSGGTTTEVTPNITSANTFQSATIDLSGVTNANKDVINSIIITVINADVDNTFYLDNMLSYINNSVNDTITRTIAATDFSGFTNITYWVYSSTTGTFATFQFGETSSSEQTNSITINSANTWEQKTWDISGIGASSRDSVTKFAFQFISDTSGAIFYFDDIITNNVAPQTPIIDYPSNNASVPTASLNLTLHAFDADNDFLRYYLKLCTDLAMSIGCSIFDQTSSQTGWTGQNASSNTAYNSGSTAVYTIPFTLNPDSNYYWNAKAIDPLGSNTWSSTTTTSKFTTTTPPKEATACLSQKNNLNTSVYIRWFPQSNDEDGFAVEKKTDSGAFVTLATLGPGVTGVGDTGISSGHIYQYRVASYYTGPTYSTWCTTPILNLQLGNFRISK